MPPSVLKIGIKNYQVIQEAYIEAIGITMIRGSTNNGKSSLIRAVEAGMFNASGDDFINDHADSCTISMEFPPEEGKKDLSFSWTKSKKGTSYVINGEGYSKLGRGGRVPALEECGVREVVVRENHERLFFWKQLIEPLFLVYGTPSYIFDFVSTIMHEKKMFPVVKSMSADIKITEKELISIEALIEAHKQNLEAQKKKEVTFSQIEKMEVDIIELRRRRVALERWSKTVEDVEAIDHQVYHLGVQLDRTNAFLKKVPSFSDVTTKVSKLEDLSQKYTELRRVESSLAHNKKVSELIEDVIPLKTSLEETVSSKDAFVLLSGFLVQLQDIVMKLGMAEESMVETEATFSKANQEFAKFKQEVGFCPTCGKSLTE